ncbi:MAG: DUF192 domain-containing protein [Deltaproteobacteria bacterium]|nr:DUF192 domain-containing protein [Deltaproteobacteria bacterium]MBW2725731.1 DUF192 domain-containing protein [Deltaproteobacteria bacterium]
MSPAPRSTATLGIAITLLTTLACEAQPAAAPVPSITIRDQTVQLEIAGTRAEQEKGLGDRDSLAWGRGMLFEYSEPRFAGFWMKDMRFDIDIVWIRDSRIVDLSHRVKHSPEGPGPTIRPRELVDTVLEVPAGFAQANGWRVGDRTEIRRAQPANPR